MTELRKDENIIFKDCNGVIDTHFSTFAAICAFFFNDFRNREEDWLTLVNLRFQEEMRIGFFHIAVKKLNGLISIQG